MNISENFWRLLCWLAPASWWFNRLRHPRLASIWVWIHARGAR